MKKLLMVVVMLIFSCSAIAGDWKYQEHHDEMRGTMSKEAYTVSLNKVDFPFPYNGGSSMRLYLTQSNNATDPGTSIVFISIPSQVDCENCKISVKFDDGQIEVYRAFGNKSALMIETSDRKQFLEKLKNAKKLIIEAGFYDAGNQQFKFDVSDLKWE